MTRLWGYAEIADARNAAFDVRLRYALHMNLSRSLRTYVATHLTLMLLAVAACSRPPLPASGNAINIDRLDVTVPKLQQLYADKRYTVTQVVQWHLDRIDRYNDVYGAIETMLRDDALADAAWLDAASSKSDVRGRESARVPLRPAVDNVGRHERRRPRALHRYGRRVMIVVVCCVIGICMPAIGTSTVILISFDRLPPMNTPPAPMIMVP